MNASIDNVYAIILAAGASSRLGQPKQLLEWRDQSLLEHAIQTTRCLLKDRVFVVLGAHAELIRSAFNLDNVTLVFNPDWQEGIASSIRAGIQSLPASTSAALILLCDQPLISAEHIQALLTGWQNEPTHMIASQYNHAIGVPALFPAEFFEPLLELRGDQGAKRLLMNKSSRLLKIPLPEAKLDIDTIGDFNYLTRHYSAEE